MHFNETLILKTYFEIHQILTGLNQLFILEMACGVL